MKKEPYIIGLIGGVATGKTVVANILEAQGAHIIDTDMVSRELVEPGMPAYKGIVAHFDQDVLAADATINRTRLRRLIFENPVERQWLENLLHPMIRAAVAEQARSSQSNICVIAIPLLTDRDDYPYLDAVWLVTAEEAVRIDRLVKRDGIDWALARKMIANQPSIDVQKQLADRVIENQGNLPALQKMISELLLEVA